MKLAMFSALWKSYQAISENTNEELFSNIHIIEWGFCKNAIGAAKISFILITKHFAAYDKILNLEQFATGKNQINF